MVLSTAATLSEETQGASCWAQRRGERKCFTDPARFQFSSLPEASHITLRIKGLPRVAHTAAIFSKRLAGSLKTRRIT